MVAKRVEVGRRLEVTLKRLSQDGLHLVDHLLYLMLHLLAFVCNGHTHVSREVAKWWPSTKFANYPKHVDIYSDFSKDSYPLIYSTFLLCYSLN
jgi:hypothetical protein